MRLVRLLSALLLLAAMLATATPADAAVSIITRPNGIIDVNGTNAAEVVGICQEDGVISVVTESGTTDLPAGVRSIRVNLRGGDDTLTVGAEVCGSSLTIPLDLRVVLGSGDDDLNIDDVSVGRNLLVLGQAGEEMIFMSDTSAARLTMNTSSGPSRVDVSDTSFGRASVRGGTSADIVMFRTTDIGRNPTFITSAGKDEVTLDLPSATGRVTMNVGSGDDLAAVIDPNNCSRTECVGGLNTASDYLLNVIMGGGNDVTRTELNLRTGDRLNGGAGNSDRLEFFSPGGATINGYEFFDQVTGNNPPEANDDFEGALAGEPVENNLTFNDSDPDGDPLTIIEINGQPVSIFDTVVTGQDGEVQLTGAGTVVYTSFAEFEGTDTFTYTISDGRGGTDQAEVFFSVEFPNNQPMAVDDFASTDFETPVDIPVLDNDSDPDVDPLSVTQIQSIPVSVGGGTVPVPGGTAELLTGGVIRFTPNTGFSGLAQFLYTLDDGRFSADTGEVFVTVGGPPNTPAVIGGDLAGTATEDDGLIINGTATVTDPDPGEDVFQAAAGAATYGSYTTDSSGNWTYDLDDTNPTVNALNVGGTLNDTFTITSDDGTTATVNITINGANDPATIGGDNFGIATEDDGLILSGTATSTDADNPDNMFQPDSGNTTYGTFTIAANGDWTYDLDDTNPIVDPLNSGDEESDLFVIATVDGTTAAVAIDIFGTNDPAIIGGDLAGTATEDDGLIINGTATATDVDNTDNLFQAATGSATYGSYTTDSSGNWTYDLDDANPAVNALNVGGTLSDSFTITSDDGTTATVNITINGRNDPPTAVDDFEIGGIIYGGTVTVLPVANDSDPEGDPLTIIQIEGLSITPGGPAINIGDGNLFTLAADGVTLDVEIHNVEDPEVVFNYTISDGNGGTATAVVTIQTVEP